MKHEFENCIKRNKIREFSEGINLYPKECEAAAQDLKEARDSFSREQYKWSTIQSYYAMFHTARALLYKKRYREKSHYCLIIALKELYVSEGLIPVQFVEALVQGKNLRENADYYDDWSETSAKEMLDKAGDFLKRAKEILK